MFSRLQRQLMVICVVGTGIVLIIMSLVSLRFSRNLLQEQAADTFDTTLDGILLHVMDTSVMEHGWLAQTEANNDLYLTVYYEDSPLQFTHLKEARAEGTAAALTIAMEDYGYDAMTPLETLRPTTITFAMEEPSPSRGAVSKTPHNGEWVTVVVVKSLAKENQQIASLQLFFTIASIVALLALGLFAWFFAGQAIKPIEENHKRQTDFISSASHEIRSPLAVIQATAGAMKQAPPELVEQFATTIEEECERLDFLTQDLLTLASADRITLSYHPVVVEPETLLLSTGERFEHLAKEKHITLETLLPDTLLPKITADPQRLEQLFAVLVDNALSYTPEGGQVRLSLTQEGKLVCFWVEDSGPGVLPADREHVFDRFYRADASRTKKKHYGLGLSIAKEIAQLHGGTLSLDDSTLGGARFIFSVEV